MRVEAMLPFRKCVGALAVCACTTAFLVVPGGAAAAGCDRVAAPDGSDSALGTVAAPVRTVSKLLATLGAGQTGCLVAGTSSAEEFKLATAGVTLTSYPGGTATLHGRIWVAANNVTLSGLNLDGRNSRA